MSNKTTPPNSLDTILDKTSTEDQQQDEFETTLLTQENTEIETLTSIDLIMMDFEQEMETATDSQQPDLASIRHLSLKPANDIPTVRKQITPRYASPPKIDNDA